jgi:hypothetical protein
MNFTGTDMLIQEGKDRLAAAQRDQYVVERWVREYYANGIEGGAAARQLCRDLGCSGNFPTLKKMLEEMLADGNRGSHERATLRSTIRELFVGIVRH